MNVAIKHYQFTPEQKSHIMDYLLGNIGKNALAEELDMSRIAVYTMCTSILKFAAREGKGVQEALNDY